MPDLTPESPTVEFYRVAIGTLFVAMAESSEETEIDSIDAEIQVLTVRMREVAFNDIANRTPSLRALLVDLQRITRDLTGPAFGQRVRELVAVTTTLTAALGQDPTNNGV